MRGIRDDPAAVGAVRRRHAAARAGGFGRMTERVSYARTADDVAFSLSLPVERSAWKVAEAPDGAAIGFIIPMRTAYDASISYLGVVPEHRGHGYVHDLLAEMVHVHHDNAETRIVGTTDLANAPVRAMRATRGRRRW